MKHADPRHATVYSCSAVSDTLAGNGLLSCGCKVTPDGQSIIWCPPHAQAEAMLAVIRKTSAVAVVWRISSVDAEGGRPPKKGKAIP